MPEYNFDKPIFIIGAARSGTTMLGEIMQMHSDVAYWLEPKYIWRYGTAGKADDQLFAKDVTNRISRYIRKQFFLFMEGKKKSRFVEKTPSNVFRIDFIDRIFPEARYIYLVRDGRDVSLSAEKKWTSRPDKSALKRRLSSFEIPFRDLPFYILSFLRDVPARIIAPGQGYIWGPQFDGIRKYRSEHSVIETCAKQWLESVCEAEKALSNIQGERVLKIKYEELISEPKKYLKEIFGFAELDFSMVEEMLDQYAFKHKRTYSSEQEKKLENIYSIIADKLKELNYS